MSAILSPETPADIYPVPYARRRVDKTLPLAKNMVASLREVGVRTLGEFDAWIEKGNDVTSLKGIGAITGQKIMDAWNSLQETKYLGL